MHFLRRPSRSSDSKPATMDSGQEKIPCEIKNAIPPPSVTATRSPSATFILRGQAVGFSLLLGLMWTAELLHLPYHLFGDSPEFKWTRIGLRTAILLIIWLVVHITTSRLLRRLHELETFLRICSWCRKVDDHGEWRTMEDYFDARFQTGTSHGICPACARRQLAQYPSAARVRTKDKPGS